MAYTYDINHTCVDKKSKNCLFVSHSLSNIISLFVTTFLVAHIYSFSGDTYSYLFNVAIYNISLYLAVALFYIPISKIVDRTNRIVVYRISLIVKAVLVTFFIFFGEEIAKLLVFAGVINGLSEALYYSSYNIIKQEMVSRKDMGRFASSTYVFVRIIDMVCPILLGALIDATSFSSVAIVVFVVCAIQLIFSFGVKCERPEGSNFNLTGYIRKLKTHKDRKKLGTVYLISFLYGVTIMVTNVLNVCIMLEFGSSFSLGIITSVFSAVTILVVLWLNRYTKAGRRSWLYILCSILQVLSVIVFAIDITSVTVIIFNGVIVITSIVYQVVFDVHRNSTIKEGGLYSEISEHHAVVEVLLNVTRVLCFIVLIVVALLKSMFMLKAIMVVAVLVKVAIFMLLLNYEKKYYKQSVNK